MTSDPLPASPPPTASAPPPPFSASIAKRLRKLLFSFLKFAIAIVGIWWVVHNTTWNDTATLPANSQIRSVTFLEDTDVIIVGESASSTNPLVRIRFPGKSVSVRLELPAGVRDFKLVIDENTPIPGTQELLNVPRELEIPPDRLQNADGTWKKEGLHALLIRASAKWYLLVAAWAVLSAPFFVTAIRWRNLMRPQGINMPLGKCLQLTFVGQFYSIMLPGITGGDLVKIVYAARLTGSKTKSFITIILDRVIGLVALMVIAGTSAGIQMILNARNNVHTENTLVNVFVMIVVLLLALAVGSTIYFSHRLRRVAGIEWFIENFGKLTTQTGDGADQAEQHRRLEHLFRINNVLLLLLSGIVIAVLVLLRWYTASVWAQKNTIVVYGGIGVMSLVGFAAAAALLLHGAIIDRLMPSLRKAVGAIIHIDETLHVYRGHFGVLFWAFVISLVSQLTLPLSAFLSGRALGMTAPVTHYLAYVPVAVLAASLPISPPQGLGLMDSLFLHFFKGRGTATAGQAVALAQAVRFLPILWNLVGAYWVITGKYSRQQIQDEQRSLRE